VTSTTQCLFINIYPNCVPDDNLIQTVRVENHSLSLLHNDNLDRISQSAFILLEPHYRPVFLSLKNVLMKDLKPISPLPTFGIIGTFIDEVMLEEFLITNTTSQNDIIQWGLFSSLVFENMIFKDITDNNGAALRLLANMNVNLTNLRFDNIGKW